MKILGNEIKPGMVIEHKNDLWSVLKAQHVKPGKGGAFNQVELKSINKGKAKATIIKYFIDYFLFQFQKYKLIPIFPQTKNPTNVGFSAAHIRLSDDYFSLKSSSSNLIGMIPYASRRYKPSLAPQWFQCIMRCLPALWLNQCHAGI